MIIAELEGEAPDWIIAEAGKHGLEISHASLRDWHSKGLIPAPRQYWPDEHRGSVSRYPEGTLLQAICCKQLFNKGYSKERVGWELWVLDFEPDRNFHEAALKRTQRRYSWLAAKVSKIDEDDVASEKLHDALHDPGNTKRLTGLLGKAKQRLGHRLDDLFPLAFTISNGDFRYLDNGGSDEKRDRELLARALNLEPGKNKKSYRDPEFFPSDFVNNFLRILSLISELRNVVFRAEYLSSITSAELRESAREIYLAIALHDLLEKDEREKRGGKSHPFFSLLPFVMKGKSANTPVFMTLVWSALRRNPEFSEGMRDIKAALSEGSRKINDNSNG